MKTVDLAFLTLILAALVASVAQAGEPPSWGTKMRGLEQTLQELLIDVSSDERFNSPKNFKRIEKNALKFSRLAHELKSSKGGIGASPDADPSIQIIAGHFAQEADIAYKTLAWGHRPYARNLLRAMTSYCIACHTRNGSGPSFGSLGGANAAAGLKGLEKANFLASTRQFDRALEEYERAVSESASAEHMPFDWERAIRSGLSIAIRVKKDPDRALSIVERVLAERKAPYYIRQRATQWKDSILAWKSEAAATPQTEDGYRARAIKLIAEAKAIQKYPADRSADVVFLRASAAVHDLLALAPNGKYTAEALYLAGLCYEVLHDLSLWDVHEYYYLACMMKAPHTDEARRCYKHYEESIYSGYTGSGGTHIPAEIKAKLRDLDRLSGPAEDVPLAAPGQLR